MTLTFSNGPEYSRLRKVLMYIPGDEVKYVDGRNYRDMLFRRPVDYNLLYRQFNILIDVFRGEGVEVILLNELFELAGWRPSLTPPNMMFIRDVFGVIKDSVILGNMAYEVRRMEPIIMGELLRRLKLSDFYVMGGKKYFEGGDLIQLNNEYLLIGYGPRTSFPAALEISSLAREAGLNTILISMPPYRVHLDGGMMPLDRDLIIAHRPSLEYYPSLVIYRDGSRDVINTFQFLRDIGYTFIEVDDEESKNFGPNTIVLYRGKVISYSWNSGAIESLREYGIDVIPFDGTEVSGAGGGPHCIFNTLERR